MIPHIVHLTTKNGLLNPDEARILEKNRRALPGWDFRVYSDADNRQIMEQHFPEWLEKYDAIRRGVMKADIVRCLYLYLYGGLYIDTDYQLFKPIPDEWLESECVIPTEHFEPDGTPFLGNCIFFSQAGYPFWKDYVVHLFEKMDLTDTPESQIIGMTGPGGVTRFYLAHCEQYPGLRFTPQPVFHPLILWHGLRVARKTETVGAHFCFGSWRGKTESPWRKWIYSTIQHLQARGLHFNSCTKNKV